MKLPIKKQSGLTFIGLCIVLAIIVVFVLFGLRVFPLYNEKLQIESAINSVVNQPDSAWISNIKMPTCLSPIFNYC